MSGIWSGARVTAMRAGGDTDSSREERVAECVERLRHNFNAESLDDADWQHAKLYYIGMLVNHKQPELLRHIGDTPQCVQAPPAQRLRKGAQGFRANKSDLRINNDFPSLR